MNPYKQLCMFLILATTTYGFATIEESPSSQQKSTAVVFDLGGVLLKTDRFAIMKQLGLSTLARYMILEFKSPTNLKKTLYKTLDAIDNQTYAFLPIASDPDGTPLPSLMNAWLAGLITSENLLRNIDLFIEFHHYCKTAHIQSIFHNIDYLTTPHRYAFSSKVEQVLIQRLAHAIFSPHSFASVQEIIPEGLELVKKCKQAGHRVCILSNWDPASFQLIFKKHPQLFDLFDEDDIIISGNYGMTKPDPRIYELLKQKLGNAHIIFIDDQQVNVVAAQNAGIATVHLTSNNSYDKAAIAIAQHAAVNTIPIPTT